MPPLFTIVIPTRNREWLARKAASYVLSQSFAEFELLILDNSDQHDLLTEEFDDSRCTVVPSESVLSMRDNWERLFDHAHGEYVIVLSDKDMFLPRALERLAAVARETQADMITFRKACFGHEAGFVSTIQRCSGGASRQNSSAVLRAWFGEVQHYHDAPMIYNSAVRRKTIVEMRNESGRFFVGTSPDIGSGAILMARLDHYLLLDRPLVMSWYGGWSIGVASSRGAEGAAAACLAEYSTNPIEAAGFVNGVPGSVAETLLACKGQFPLLFSRNSVRWSSYVRSALWDLLRREQAGMDVTNDRDFVRSTRGKQYSWFDARVGALRFQWERIDLKKRLFARKKHSGYTNATSQGSPYQVSDTGGSSTSIDIAKTIESYFNIREQKSASFRDVPCLELHASSTFDDAFKIACAINEQLDARAVA